MATTTNYSWTTPDDTALVKDGAAAIRTLGSSVDTTVKNLNPETTLGDIAYRSSTANVKTRLGLGSAGQILTVNSGATAPEWATPSSGSMTVIATGALSGSSVTLSSISGSYKDLYLLLTSYQASASNNGFRFRLNGNTGANYVTAGYYYSGSAFAGTVNEVGLYPALQNGGSAVPSTSNNRTCIMKITDYASAKFHPITMTLLSGLADGTESFFSNSYFASAAAITEINIGTSSAVTFTAGTYTLYGVN
jgi:hypothetical protein